MSPTQIGSWCDCGWIITFPKIYVRIYEKPHTGILLVRPWLDRHVPESLHDEYEKPHTVSLLVQL